MRSWQLSWARCGAHSGPGCTVYCAQYTVQGPAHCLSEVRSSVGDGRSQWLLLPNFHSVIYTNISWSFLVHLYVRPSVLEMEDCNDNSSKRWISWSIKVKRGSKFLLSIFVKLYLLFILLQILQNFDVLQLHKFVSVEHCIFKLQITSKELKLAATSKNLFECSGHLTES